jgi:Flp pilus assembly protein TadB
MTGLGWIALATALLLAGGPLRRRPAAGRAGGGSGRRSTGGSAGRAGGRRSATGPVDLVRRAAGRPEGGRDPALPLVLDLTAAALRAGRPLPTALELAAPAAGPEVAEALARVARLLRLGAEPAAAWAGVPPGSGVAPVVPVAVRSAASGAKLAAAFERLAADLRAEHAARAAARAERAGVLAMAPLAACFLPSFVCLGIVPVIAGIASTVLRTPP